MRMWEIREKDHHSYDDYRGNYRMGMRDKSVDEAYECGFEDGYEAAMKEMKESSSRSYRSMRDDESDYRRRR